VARLLVADRISGLPVVGETGEVLGVVSEADFLLKGQGELPVRHRPLSRFLGGQRETKAQLAKLRATTAGEAMTAPPVVIGPDRPLNEAAALMMARQVNRLPVVEDGRLVGIVTRGDLVRAYVRTDEELARTIREDVLLRVLWLDPSSFEVGVHDGVVAIAGTVERRSMAGVVEHAVRMVPGVVDVRADLQWAIDDGRIHPEPLDPVHPFTLR
jgi:predicted transcriptional regulator